MEVKIITQEEAVKMGLSNPPANSTFGRGSPDFIYGLVGKVKDPKKKHLPEEIHEIFRLNNKTKEKEILHETKEFKKLKKDLKMK
jgi:hypothetical protein